MQFRFGLLGPPSVIHDGQAALMTPGNQRIAQTRVRRRSSELLAKHQSCHKRTDRDSPAVARHLGEHNAALHTHANWQRGKSLSTLEAADLNGDGVPDLWAVTPDGIARAYLISNLSATGSAKIEPQKPQKLS